MIKRWLSFVLAAVLLCGNIATAAAVGTNYWTLQTAFNKAVESKNPDQIITTGNAILTYYNSPKNADEYGRAAWPCQKVALAYEQKGNYPQAAAYYKRFLSLISWLNAHGSNYQDLIKTTKSLIAHIDITPEVYAESSVAAPYFGAKAESQNGTCFGVCDAFSEGSQSAYLLYVQFFNQSIASFAHKLPDTSQDYLLEIGWNVPNENLSDLQRIADGSSDAYILENAKYLGTLSGRVLLRFGAEVNCWNLPADATARQAFIDTYVAAFRKVATAVHQYAPQVAMVYSPNDVSNWYVDVTTFYPGDAYVDWVGMSSYMNLSANAANTIGSGTDAYYARGLYDNQLVKIKPILDAYGSKKPILISECGSAYADTAGLQNPSYAAKKISAFYAYVNMLYPQVKGILYFDNNYSSNSYKLSGNAQVKSAYEQATASNGVMQASITGQTRSYVPMTKLKDSHLQTLKLYTYAAYPTKEAVTVTYTLDGKALPGATAAPYAVELDLSQLSVGQHQLVAKISCRATTITKSYILTVDASGAVQSTAGTLHASAAAQTKKQITATPTNSKVIVNGQAIAFDAYNIADNNYFKLRDIAKAISETEKKFNVVWDENKNAINIVTGSSYFPVGGELTQGRGKAKPADASTAKVYKDNDLLTLSAYTIENNNYFKLRDLGKALAFAVYWDETQNAIIIDTAKPYTAQ